jgi:hypothetical protein
MVLDGPTNRNAFLAYVHQVLVPELLPGSSVGWPTTTVGPHRPEVCIPPGLSHPQSYKRTTDLASDYGSGNVSTRGSCPVAWRNLIKSSRAIVVVIELISG